MKKENIKTSIDPLRKEEKNLLLKLTIVRNAIGGLQKLCEHEMEDVGHDSHKDYYECKWCGEESHV